MVWNRERNRLGCWDCVNGLWSKSVPVRLSSSGVRLFTVTPTWVLPLPVCPYAKHVAIPLSNMVSTSGRAVNLKAKLLQLLHFSRVFTCPPHNTFSVYTCKPFRSWQYHRRHNQSERSGSPGISLSPLSVWVRGPWPRPYWGWWWRPSPSSSSLWKIYKRTSEYNWTSLKNSQHIIYTLNTPLIREFTRIQIFSFYLFCSVAVLWHTHISCAPQSGKMIISNTVYYYTV